MYEWKGNISPSDKFSPATPVEISNIDLFKLIISILTTGDKILKLWMWLWHYTSWWPKLLLQLKFDLVTTQFNIWYIR